MIAESVKMQCRTISIAPLLAAFAVLASGCSSSSESEAHTVRMTVTAYCACRQCCGWERTFWGRPVVVDAQGNRRRKAVGICADGTRARRGVAAADGAFFPFGTRLEVPGYGRAVVHDRGGDIVGPSRLDIFFARHSDAVRWGRRELWVKVYDMPPPPRGAGSP